MIRLDVESHLATATMEAPPVNAINPDWIARLDAILDAVEANPKISVLRIRSALKVYCGGADLAVMRDLLVDDEGRDEMIEIVRGIQRVFFRLEKARVVTIAEIAGAALGGGLELALSCDLRVATKTSKIGLPEAKLGLLPGAGGTQRLSRICGDAVSRRLILGAEVLSGEEAAAMGVVHWAVPAEEQDAFVRDLAARIGTSTPEALASCKKCIEAYLDPDANGYEVELSETRRLHDVPETQRRVRALLDRNK